MRWIGWGIAAIAPMLVGCTAVPREENVTRKSTVAIVKQVRCEAKQAVLDYAYHYKDPTPFDINYKTASIAYDFTFDVTEDNKAGADATWRLPYTLGAGDFFSLFANGHFDRNRFTHRNFRIIDSFEELYHTDCSKVSPQPENLIYPISGEIGMYEVIKTFIKLQQIANPKAGEVFTYSDTLTFNTFLSAGVQPSLVVSPFPDRFRLASANGDFSASRRDIHEVVVSMAGDKPGASGAKKSGTALGASARSTAADIGGLQTNSSLVSTTLLQTGSNPRDRALLELDRQQIIKQQNRTLGDNLLIGP
jgi:hypothetical protein